MQQIQDLQTPALVVDANLVGHNLDSLAVALPGERARPHVKAHKCTALAKLQVERGHPGLTCATIREMEGLARAGLGGDLLLANEVLDTRRLGALDARVTVAVDSEETVDAAAVGGVGEVLIDVNVGLPRCGCDPSRVEALADRARRCGLSVRGVMGYEGHLMLLEDRAERERRVTESMAILETAHGLAGGDVISAGGTGTFDLNRAATEIQAGSYALMDTAYAKLDLPFRPALSLLATVISVSEKYAVADCGLKALGMDHGNPQVEGGTVWFCSDEHVTFAPQGRRPRSEATRAFGSGESSEVGETGRVSVGDRVRVWPAHVDPTVAYHERMFVAAGDDIVDVWEVDLRGW